MFFSVSYLIGFPIVVQLLHSVQALPDSSDKLGPVSETFKLNDAQRGLASAKKTAGKMNCVTRVRLQNYGKPSLYILQSTFPRTLTSLSKQKRLNAHDHNSATSYFDDETSGAFYS